jgi:cytochrome P450
MDKTIETEVGSAEDVAARPEIVANHCGLEFDPTLARLLEDEPVSRINIAYGAKTPWLVSRYDDIQAVTSDKRFSRAPFKSGELQISSLLPTFVPPPDAVQVQDEPKAGELRQAMAKGMTSRRMNAFRPTAERIINDLLDGMADLPGPVDLVSTLTGRYPLDLMAELIGIPEVDREQVRRWTRLLFSARPEEAEESAAAIHHLGSFASELVRQRQKAPGKDMLSRIVADPNTDFSSKELVGITVQLIAIGIAPTNALLTDIVYLLLTDERLGPVRDDPSRIDAAFDEVCRFAPVINGFGPGLVAKEDIEVGGVTIPAGDVVSYSYSSGNHDPRRFPQPENLDLGRKNVKHLNFGSGMYACIAEHFSRLVVSVVVQALFGQFPGIQMGIPGRELEWDNGTIWRCPSTLPVVLESSVEN